MSSVSLEPEIKSSILRLCKIYEDFASKTTFLKFVNDDISLQSNIQYLFSQRFENCLDQALHVHILEHALKAEQIAPGSITLFLNALIEGVKGNQPLDREGDTVSHRVPSRSDLVSYVKKMTPGHHSSLGSMVLDALDLAGMSGKIIVEKTTTRDHIEHVSGHVFKLLPAMPTENLRYVNPYVTCIDAYVESVSQIEAYLGDVMETSETCFLFARGFSEEVLNTIGANVKNGNMKLVLIDVPVEYESVNCLVDIAVISGIDVTSTAKGELLSSLRLADQKQVERIDVLKGTIVVFNKRFQQSVAIHRNGMIQRRNEEHDFVSKYTDLRIRSMTPNTVYVRLVDNSLFVNRAQFIDACLRGVKSMIAYGTEIVNENSVPALANDVGNIFALKCLTSLQQMGAAVLT